MRPSASKSRLFSWSASSSRRFTEFFFSSRRRHTRCLSDWSSHVCSSDLAEPLRQRADRVAKWATRLTWLFPAAYPLALRERSLILAASGQTTRALKYADKSCAVAERQKARYEHAQSLLLRGKLARQLGHPEADEQIRAAEAAIQAI